MRIGATFVVSLLLLCLSSAFLFDTVASLKIEIVLNEKLKSNNKHTPHDELIFKGVTFCRNWLMNCWNVSQVALGSPRGLSWER